MTVKQPADFARAVYVTFFVALVALVSTCVVCSAQQPPPAPTQTGTTNTDDANNAGKSETQPDISITGSVTASELKFNVVPNPKVEFTGRARRETVWEADRVSLPPAVRPGETYRNIGITLRITSVFADIDRIVAEALGEIPLSDETPRDEPTPPQPPPQQQLTPPASSPGAQARTTPNRATRRTNAARRGTRR